MNKTLMEATVHYCHLNNLPVVDHDWKAIRSDEKTGRRIAAAYEAAPVLSTDALPAYRAMLAETRHQYEYLIDELGIHVEIVAEDPYGSARELREELAEGRLRVWATKACNNSHPFFSDDDNDVFRAVHDAFGHGATERGFDRHGEEATWLKHSQMYTPLARPAVTTETRGQSCAYFYGNDAQHFSVQKAVLLPPEFWA